MKRKNKEILEPIQKLKNDLEHTDPHFRQNAVIGLGKYFENEEARQKLSEEEKTLIISLLLKCLEPKEESVDVKTRTIKIFKEISIHISEAEIIQIFSNIIKLIIDPKEEGKEIYVNCIKSILENVPGSSYETIGKIIIEPLTKGLDSKDQEIIFLCLDTFNKYIKIFDYELIKRNYREFTIDEEKIVKVALENINNNNESLKSSSIQILVNIGVLLKKDQILNTTQTIIDLIKKSDTITKKQNYILGLKSLGHTLSRSQGEKIPEIIELLISFLSKNFLDSEGVYDEKNSLVEAALNTIEIYISTSMSLITEKIPTIIEAALELITYDPGNTNSVEKMAIEGYGDFEEVEDFDACLEDSSWKVRRAACQILRMILASGYDINVQIKEKIINSLINNFGEQEENTKLEINLCLRQYLTSLVRTEKTKDKMEVKRVQSVLVIKYIPTIAKGLIEKIAKDLNSAYKDEIKSSTLKILPSLVVVCPDEIINNYETLKEGLSNTCFKSNENSFTLMSLLSDLFLAIYTEHEYSEITKDIIEYLTKGIDNSYYKVSTEAIKASGQFCVILSQELSDNKGYIMSLYDKILPKFKAQDIDSEIKLASSYAISNFIEYCGELIKNEIKELFKIYIEKTKNDLIKAEILIMLNDIFAKDNKDIKLEIGVDELKTPLLELLESASQQNLIRILTIFDTFYKKYPNVLKDSTPSIVDKLLKLKIKEGIIPNLFNVFKKMFSFLDEKKIKSIFDYTENILSENNTIDNSFLSSLFDFTRLGCSKLKQEDLVKIVEKYSPKMNELNENMIYFLSIIICYSGKEPDCLNNALQQLETLANDTENQKKTEKVLDLIGDICENSQQNHDDLLSKLDEVKKKLGNKISEPFSKIEGKIGVNNPIGFINKLISQNQDQYSRMSLKEFLNLIERKNIKITDANIDGLITWLLNTPKLEEENINKSVGICFGLIAKLDTAFIKKYIDLLNENNDHKKSSILYGAKEIFKSKLDFPESVINPVYRQILEGIKSPERLIKEHSLQALSYMKYKYPKVLLKFYCEKENMKFIGQSCKTDTAYIQEADFGQGNKIVDDRGKGIRQAALDIETFIIDVFPNKLVFEEIVPLLIECLLDTEDYLQQIVYNDLIKLAKLKPTAFSSFGGQLIKRLISVYKSLKLDESKKNYALNVKNLFEELKGVKSVTDDPQYNMIVEKINSLI